ncbi:MAG TPA: NIPSNAP family protein [Thalassobaculum sp.]
MIHQLRIYEIFEPSKAAFHARFRDHAARLMRGHGFDIRAMWETTTEARTEFVYILAWPDEATMRARWAGFMADPEWNRVKRETGADGPLVGAIEDRVLRLVDYSPVP